MLPIILLALSWIIPTLAAPSWSSLEASINPLIGDRELRKCCLPGLAVDKRTQECTRKL